MSAEAFSQQLAAAQARLALDVPKMARAGLLNDPAEVARWLEAASRAMVAKDYVPTPSPEDEPALLRLWTNHGPWAPNPWFVAATAHSSPLPVEDADDPWEPFIGTELGSLRVPQLDLIGSPDVQAWYAGSNNDHPGAAAVAEFLLLAICDLIDQSLRLADAVSGPVAMSQGEDERIWLWPSPGSPARFIRTG